jgi:hypothetical protein
MIQRYHILRSLNDPDGELLPRDNGVWIRFADHESENAALRQRVQQLESNIGEVNDAIGVIDLCMIVPLIENLRARISELEEAQRWIPITDIELLKTYPEVLVMNANQGNVVMLVFWNKIHGYWQSKSYSISFQYTHYHLLPGSPHA